MKRLVLMTAFLVFAFVANSSAVTYGSGAWLDYEYYQKTSDDGYGFPGQRMNAGDSYSFFFDLVYLNDAEDYAYNPYNPTGTDSQLALQNDVEGYTNPNMDPNTKPVGGLWSSVTIYSEDTDYDQFDLDVTAYFNDVEYDLGQSVTNNTSGYYSTINFDFGGDLLDAWINDPYGLIELNVDYIFPENYTGYNDFNLIEVGVGVAPVPEPATLLLLGSGLVGLAFLKRRKL